MRWRKPRRGIESGPRRKSWTTPEDLWRTLTGLGLVLVMVGGAVLGLGSARADTNASGHGPGQYVSWSNYRGLWLGAYQTTNGLAMCVTPSGDSPIGQGGSDPYVIPPGWVNDEGAATSAQQLAEVGYILWWLGPSPTDYAAGMARLAVFTVLGYDAVNVYGSSRSYDFDVFTDGSDGQQIADQLGMLPDVQQLVNDARTRANTWDGSSPQMTTNLDQISEPGEVIQASVQFSGIPAGYEVRVTVETPDGSTEDIPEVTDGDGQASMSYETSAVAQGTYRVTYSMSDVPPSAPVAYWPGGSNPQNMFFAAPPARSTASPTPAEVTLAFHPTVSTQVSDEEVAGGDVLTDTVRMDNLQPSLSWSVDGMLHGPAPAVDGSCEGVDWSDAPVAAEFTHRIDASEIDGTGIAVIEGLGPWKVQSSDEDLCVSYSEQLSGRDWAGDVQSQAQHPAGSAHQTALVARIIPEIPPVAEASVPAAAGPVSVITGGRSAGPHRFGPVSAVSVMWEVMRPHFR